MSPSFQYPTQITGGWSRAIFKYLAPAYWWPSLDWAIWLLLLLLVWLNWHQWVLKTTTYWGDTMCLSSGCSQVFTLVMGSLSRWCRNKSALSHRWHLDFFRRQTEPRVGQLGNDAHLIPINLVLYLPLCGEVCQTTGEMIVFDLSQGIIMICLAWIGFCFTDCWTTYWEEVCWVVCADLITGKNQRKPL